ncbi:Conserved oligomeric Golgi complex subunit 2 [Ophiophagus hannah]|uniref:Conserved oligomeric Golgi complex subunit 2 n=1 Tax=Ophiophagus hannah TaxID=8665 RepID=V8NU08_OPHHA|nr:Conserved oligomeric Golgi complex subunit 2 [Ophiophagus hannah]
MNLPRGPDNLCFDKDEFMKPDFDVDHFVSECRKRVQLEELRDDLELYYKLLKTAMIELINKDYADFVNLSTNLVGMDKALNQLSVPLGQLREEVMSLKSCVSEEIRAIDDRLSKQEDIRKKKMCVLRLIQVIKSVEKIEKILHSQNSKETSLEVSSPLLTGQILERIATEFNQLQFHAVQSKGMPLLDKLKPRIVGITATLQQSLEGLLLEGLQTSNIDIIRHCLRTYATIDKTRDAEALVGEVLVKPYIDEVIVEQYVQSQPNGLQTMYSKLLEFVPLHCRLLREVTGGGISSERGNTVPGYDFLVNSVWPEIVRGLEIKLPSLFNPGNPDLFHERSKDTSSLVKKPSLMHDFCLQKYNISMDFVRKFERQCGSQASVKRLRLHPSYQSFNDKWNLPVYFQIRFREIAGALEAALSDGLEEAPVQLLKRYVVAIIETLAGLLLRPVSNETVKDHKKTLASKESSLNSVEDQGNESCPDAQPLPSISTTQLVFVAADLDRLQEWLPELLEMIKPKLDMIGFKNIACISGSLEDSKNSLLGSWPTLNSKIIQDLNDSCFSCLKSALEIPRLYRRTNKEVPTKALPYVDSALKPFHQLKNDYKDILKPAVIEQWLEGALNTSTQKYLDTVSDILHSVKKMEESLKRLKQARKTVTANNPSPSGGMSDDNKIRLQLALDVEHFGMQMEKMGMQLNNIKSFSTLSELVQAAKDQIGTEQT